MITASTKRFGPIQYQPAQLWYCQSGRLPLAMLTISGQIRPSLLEQRCRVSWRREEEEYPQRQHSPSTAASCCRRQLSRKANRC